MATRIPIQLGQQRLASPVGMPAARAPMVGVQDNTGAAVAGLGQAVGRVSDAVQRQQREDALAWVSKTESDDQIKWMRRLDELKGSAEPGAPDFTGNLIREYDDYSHEALQNAPESARAFYHETLIQRRKYLTSQALPFEAAQRKAHRNGQYESGLESDSAAIALDPDLYPERRATRLAVLNNSEMAHSDRAALLAKSESTMAYAAGAAMIDRNPHAVYLAMNAAARGESTPGYGWIQHLDSDRILQLRARAQTQADRLDNRARIDQDRQTTRALRAIGEMDQQMATGMPPRSDDMLRWASMVAGTDYEQSYRDMTAGLGEVQDVLRKPIQEQQAYIQEKRRVQQTGANKTDVANLDRLERAVTANAEMMAERPLEWIATRAGIQISPLDLVGLATPDGTAQLGTAVLERADAIRAVQRANEPGMVLMRPLEPTEVRQFETAFKSAASPQRREMLAGLYRMAGGQQDVFDGMVQQIEAIDPFAARMAVRAASQETATLQSNWLSPDVVQSAGDVAALALHGDEILRAGGKSDAIKYPVPKDEEFTRAIADKVGDLYRGAAAGDSGAGDFMKDAYAVKAYYVGRAAQEGALSPDVDGDRLERAITAVLGQPVDFHGNGRVLAPWGMDESTFLARANGIVIQELNARGMAEQLGRSAQNVGLIGIGAGSYGVTLGGIPVRDPQSGEVLIINMTADYDSGRDVFGRSLSDQIPGVQQ